MSQHEKTCRLVRSCAWWEGSKRLFCPLYNDCCNLCMHPDAPRDERGDREYFCLTNEVPEQCPLRKRELRVELVG